MDRRTLLKYLGGTGSVGLLGVAGSRSMGRRRLTVSEQDVTPAETPIELNAEIVKEVATNGNAARVKVTITNSSNEPVTDLVTGWPGVFEVARSKQTAPGLQLIAANQELRPFRHPLCPTPISTYNIPTVLISIELPPGGTDTVAFDVWGQQENGVRNCIPTGAYRFTDQYLEGEELSEAFEWGFILRVE